MAARILDAERAAHEDGDAPLPSSVRRAEQRAAARENAESPPRNRNVAYAREYFGLSVRVPWSAWEGHEDSVEFHDGIVWDYDRDNRRFTVRFPPTAEWDCDDIGLTWEELRGEKPCLASPWQRVLCPPDDEVSAPCMIPQPRGHRPRDAVWDQRKNAWVDCTGRDFDPGELLAVASTLTLRHACLQIEKHAVPRAPATYGAALETGSMSGPRSVRRDSNPLASVSASFVSRLWLQASNCCRVSSLPEALRGLDSSTGHRRAWRQTVLGSRKSWNRSAHSRIWVGNVEACRGAPRCRKPKRHRRS